jgi:isopentenyl diphosphate isomerase/L-lactate dehydrogenase-like FMN-dependent dehydrogenase
MADSLSATRRRFLQYLAASPALAQQAGFAVIGDPKDAINVMEFEAAARAALPPAHFGYLATGVEDDATLQANRDGFKRIRLRPRRLVDVRTVDTRVELFGTTWDTPLMLAPVGNQKAFHAEGEMAVARGANSRKTLQILSTVTNSAVEDVCGAHKRPVWYQLYPTQRWAVTEKLVRRAEAAGCPVLVFTVDTLMGRKTDTLERSKRLDPRKCVQCHGTEPGAFFLRKPMFDGIDVQGLRTGDPGLTWESVTRLKKLTSMKVLVKGIETREDAIRCRESGADGLIVSNHGGRAAETGRGTIECLPEVVDAVGAHLMVLIDGGFRRGADVFKALALGARAVAIGRPYIWGLSAFGQAGVERVLDLLRAELELVMKQCGTRSVSEIGLASVMGPAANR